MQSTQGWLTTLGWLTETPDLFSAALTTASGRHHLIVERLPDGCWDWVVWGPTAAPPGPADGRARRRPYTQRVQGAAATAAYGMIAAEHALLMLGVDLVAFGDASVPGLQAALEGAM